MYYKIVKNDRLLGVGVGDGSCYTEITHEEYDNIINLINHKPTAHDGYGMHINAINISWEEHELPIVEEPETITADQLADMSNAELKTLMADMGIGGTMNKDNMIALIMSRQNGEVAQ